MRTWPQRHWQGQGRHERQSSLIVTCHLMCGRLSESETFAVAYLIQRIGMPSRRVVRTYLEVFPMEASTAPWIPKHTSLRLVVIVTDNTVTFIRKVLSS